ncbi:VOC family protein [Hoeflea sp. TYP-13]|uniref:VOC family protein n=1 Tax=Hoeflea sp. TYP-13 TaxID=3230023 RepID=UPI0034C68EFB
MKITRNRLHVKNTIELVDFYSKNLGMQNFGSQASPLLGYDAQQCLVELVGGAQREYIAQPDALYWKIGITLRDLDKAVGFLRSEGYPVSEPRQFADIGYMSHLRDPHGFAIELLQQGFEGRAAPAGRGHPVGGQATLAHITLRVNDIAAAREHCETNLGMRLMSVQPVKEYGFCLYFYGWSEESLPVSDVEAVENREWLWARPYALLELQHLLGGGVGAPGTGKDRAGFTGFAWQDAGGAHNYLQPDQLKDWL